MRIIGYRRNNLTQQVGAWKNILGFLPDGFLIHTLGIAVMNLKVFAPYVKGMLVCRNEAGNSLCFDNAETHIVTTHHGNNWTPVSEMSQNHFTHGKVFYRSIALISEYHGSLRKARRTAHEEVNGSDSVLA
jgi:hypothetical protein